MKDGFIADLIQIDATMQMRRLNIGGGGYHTRLVRKTAGQLEAEAERENSAAATTVHPIAGAHRRS
jgi:hypothetical protein